MLARRILSGVVRTYLRHAPTERGAHLLRRTTSPWLVARLDTGPWVRVSGVSDFEWVLLEGGASPEKKTMERFLERVRPGGTVLDVGANIGYYAVTTAARVGPSGRVVAIEPNPRAARRLRENVALNRLGNVSVIEAAASRAKGTMKLQMGADSESSSLFDAGPERAGAVDVAVTTVDAEVEAARLGQVDVLKMDVEGAEIDALHGAERLLTGPRAPALFLEANPITLRAAGATVDDMRRCVESFGYRISIIEKLRWRGEDTENWLATRDHP